MCRLLGIKKTRTTPYHPQSDGMVERFNRTLEAQLSKFADHNQKDWDLHIPFLLMAHWLATHDTTGCSPIKLMMGRAEITNWPDIWQARGGSTSDCDRLCKHVAWTTGKSPSLCSWPSTVNVKQNETTIWPTVGMPTITSWRCCLVAQHCKNALVKTASASAHTACCLPDGVLKQHPCDTWGVVSTRGVYSTHSLCVHLVGSTHKFGWWPKSQTKSDAPKQTVVLQWWECSYLQLV